MPLSAFLLINEDDNMNKYIKISMFLLAAAGGIAANDTPAITTSTLTQRLQKITVQNWSPKLHKQLTAAFVSTRNWQALNTALENWLMQNYSDTAINKDAWHAMSGLQRWCESFLRKPETINLLKPGTLQWLLGDRQLTRDLFTILSRHDDFPRVIFLLQDFYKNRPATFPAFNRLAIALAVVWDATHSPRPHRQVPLNAVLEPKCTPLERFDFWVKTQESDKADCNLTQLEPALLKFIIDAACPLDELCWAQEHVHFTRGRLGKVYSSIEYDHDRFRQRVYTWPHKTYSLKEIKRKGGICIDQAYFAAIAGKASGIPTLYFVGHGRSGGHAWFGYMKNDDTWDMDCGRYAVENYAVGTATDPQTGQPLSDHQLAFISEAYHDKPAYRDAAVHNRMTEILFRRGKPSRALDAVDTALKNAPKHLMSWRLKAALLEARTNAYSVLKAHLEAMAKQFRDYADITTEARARLATVARKAGDEETARLTEKKAIDDTRRDRHDLSVVLYRRKMHEEIKAGAWEEAGKTVREAVSKFKKEMGDAYTLTAEFIQYCLNNGQVEEANRALRHFKSRTDYKKSIQLEELVDKLEDDIRNKRRESKQ
jgi:hypothetical protein